QAGLASVTEHSAMSEARRRSAGTGAKGGAKDDSALADQGATVATSESKRRLPRSSSLNRLEDMETLERAIKEMAPDKPLHSLVDSPFSSSSGFNNFRGLLNLGLILLVVSNFRVALENIIKYGILVDPVRPIEIFLSSPGQWPCICLLLMCNIFIFIAFGLELLAENFRLVSPALSCLQVGNLAALLLVPSYLILRDHPNPFFSAPTLGIYSIVFLKLWSYRDMNSWCRLERQLQLNKRSELKRNKSIASVLTEAGADGDGGSERLRLARGSSSRSSLLCYPENLTLGNLYYFMMTPTLCYELNFPRLMRIRKRFLVKRCLELVFLPQVMAGLTQQWIIPILNNSVKPLQASEWPVVLERLLKLAIPNHLIWLIFFYVFFHSALNVAGELTLFGDRNFYKDWWNSESVTEFWTLWNVPVHRFAKRHIFTPLIHRWGFNKLLASVVVFAVSAFFHELLVSVPLRMFRLWAFLAMIMQVPFAMFVSRVLRGGQLGNMAVWLSLIIGQPLAIIMYFHDYYVSLHQGKAEGAV
ncbi:hypothetical protein BOX15_Mlig000493g7, partial [Macrostomum lignano]